MQTFFAANRAAWRGWLAANHQTAERIWLVYLKKGVAQSAGKRKGKATGGGVAYEGSVEEALCFGWIDSLIKRIDDTRYARLFTPRTNELNWSEANRRRATKMIAEGRMTEAGLAKASFLRRAAVAAAPAKKAAVATPKHMQRALRANKAAWENYNKLAPSYRRQYIGWITTAKKEETRLRRLAEAVALLAENRKLGLK